MCPICWISGFIAVLFGGSFIATVNHPISWVLGLTLIAYSIYKFYEAKKRGKKMTIETKKRNKRIIFRFVWISKNLAIQLSFWSVVCSWVAPDQRPTRSVLVPSTDIRSVLTPSALRKQTALSPSVKPPGLCIPSMALGT